MKKTLSIAFLIASLLVLADSCTKVRVETNGTFSLSLLEDYGVLVETKAVSQASSDYHVVIRNSAGIVKEGTYEKFSTGVDLTPGADYSVSAENISASDAISGRGNVRLYGGAAFAVTPNKQTSVKCTCTVANARVTVGYDKSFTDMFKTVTVTVSENSDENRSFGFDITSTHTNDDLYTYFNIDSDPVLNISVVAVRNDGTKKTFTNNVTLAAAQWSKLTLKSNLVGGQAGLNVKVDTAPIEKTEDIEVDPSDILTLTLPAQSDKNIYARYFIPTLISEEYKDTYISSNADVVLPDLVYEISGDNGATWSQISTAGDGKKLFMGLNPGTKYQFRVRYSIIVSDVYEFTTEANTQLPNSGFENYTSTHLYNAWMSGAAMYTHAFTGWNTNNESSIPSGKSGDYLTFWLMDAVVSPTSDVSKGSSAIELSTKGFVAGKSYDGWDVGVTYKSTIKNHFNENNSIVIGQAKVEKLGYGSRPNNISFDYKYSGYNNDSFEFVATLYDASSNQIASASYTSSEKKDKYTTCSAPFTYTSDAKASYITVQFNSGKNAGKEYVGHVEGSYGASPHSNDKFVGSVLKVDNVVINFNDYE